MALMGLMGLVPGACRPAADGHRLDWVAADDDGSERLGPEPAPAWWQGLVAGP